MSVQSMSVLTRPLARGHGAEGTITVHSQGGLGNQLFIYGAGLAAARAAGGRLRVDVGQHAAREDRPHLLEGLGFPADYVDHGYWPTQGRSKMHTIKRGLRGRLGIAGGPVVPGDCSWRERRFGYAEAALRQPVGSCLFGYFQAWRYLQPVADDLRMEFDRLFAERASRLRSAAAELARSRGIVLHVRRGDYLRPEATAYHGLADRSFYSGAVGLLRRGGHTGPLFVFSDDVAGASSELDSLGPFASLDAGVVDAVDELLLMSRAPALIIANSSFSWWAGWIGDRPDRPVVAPRPWFANAKLDTRDLLPPHWLNLGRNGS